jgi:Family of unknown function (DUF6339)
MLLYPRLPKTVALSLAEDLSSKPLEDMLNDNNVKHPAAIYAPTGGNRVSENLLERIQQLIRETARSFGYPTSLDDLNRRGFDAVSGIMLHEMMDITPAEASNQGVWIFMACILLPDIVRWRFPGVSGITSKERFLGGNRGLRNTLGRVWWRAYILNQPGSGKPFELLGKLGEDELVQIMERPNLAGSPFLAKQVCRSFLDTASQHPEISRSELLRDTMKRLRRLLPLMAFDALDSRVLSEIITGVFNDSVTSLSNTPP